MAASAYDMIIIGGGPAGLTAGLYAGRARFKTLLLEKLITGGQVITTDLVDKLSRWHYRIRAVSASLSSWASRL